MPLYLPHYSPYPSPRAVLPPYLDIPSGNWNVFKLIFVVSVFGGGVEQNRKQSLFFTAKPFKFLCFDRATRPFAARTRILMLNIIWIGPGATSPAHRSFAAPLPNWFLSEENPPEKSSLGENPQKCFNFSSFNNAAAGGTVNLKVF